MRILETGAIFELLNRNDIDSESKLSILKTLCFLMNRSQGEYDPKIQELVLRCLDRRDQFREYSEIINMLVRQTGLFPYFDETNLSPKEALALEIHRPSNSYQSSAHLPITETQVDHVFHKAQAEVFNRIFGGESVILSAPTSFGKSAIVDALINSGKYKNIAIVVPTIALIDEIRRRLAPCRTTHKIITHASQPPANQNIFIFTQERVVDYTQFPELDLFVIDEFYKLNPIADKERSATLNHAFYKLVKKSKQFYMLGPNIQAIPEGFPERFKCQFIRTDYQTVVTELIRLNPPRDQEEDQLVRLCKEVNGPTLIYCASPAKASKLASLLLKANLVSSSVGMTDAAEWVSEHYDPNWTLAHALRHGIGMHHGRMPRSLAQVIVRGFNTGAIKFLICTSTLIEGVNTKAKNVIIFDNKIARQKYDYFTFNNIRGRSGRMFQHFIGKVFLFHQEPQEELPFVDIPVFSQDPLNTPASLLIQLDTEDLEENSRKRVEPYRAQEILSFEVMKSNTGIDPQQQLKLALDLSLNPALLHALSWSGMPNYSQIESLCVVIWNYFVEGGMVGATTSGKQLAYKIRQLRSKSIRQLIQVELKESGSADEAVEKVLDFIRQWPQYRFGRIAMAVNRIHVEVANKIGIRPGDYSFFIGQVENLFSDPVLLALDEYGIPFPLAKKLTHIFAEGKDLDAALEILRNVDIERLNLSFFEKTLLLEAREFA